MKELKVWFMEEYKKPLLNETIYLPIVPRRHDIIKIRGEEYIVTAVIFESSSEEIVVNLASPFAME